MARLDYDRPVAGACIGATIGGLLIWVLEDYVFRGTAPGILRDLIDALAPLLGALLGGFVGYRSQHQGTHAGDGRHTAPEPPQPPDGAMG
jgi:hypothetical protein